MAAQDPASSLDEPLDEPPNEPLPVPRQEPVNGPPSGPRTPPRSGPRRDPPSGTSGFAAAEDGAVRLPPLRARTGARVVAGRAGEGRAGQTAGPGRGGAAPSTPAAPELSAAPPPGRVRASPSASARPEAVEATGAADPAAAAPSPARRRAVRSTGPAHDADDETVRKAVNTLAIVPKSTRITALGRKAYNVLLYHAQEQGLEHDVFRAPLEAVIRGVDFDSNDHALIKKHLRTMVSTTVEWQSPTTGEGSSWNVSGLLAHARLGKERGQVWVEWSYAVNLKQELLQPTVFARLRLEILSQLRSHAGVALYEICTRYKEIGQTARQHWRWWQPVLSGNPPSEKLARQEYRIFKRDTLKPAIAEINAITDIDIELVEHKQGRFVDMLQFRIRPRKGAVPWLAQPPAPVDLALVAQARRLGVPEEAAEALVGEHGADVLRAALQALQRRVDSGWPEPLRDPLRYLRSLLPGAAAGEGAGIVVAEAPPLGRPLRGDAARSASPDHGPGARASPRARARRDGAAGSGRPAAAPAGAWPAPGTATAGSGATSAAAAATAAAATEPVAPRALQERRRAQWLSQWLRRKRLRVAEEIAALPPQQQAELSAALLDELQRLGRHPSLSKRLRTAGWQHPMVLHEMVRFYAEGAQGPHWDQPSDGELLAIAAEIGEPPEPRS